MFWLFGNKACRILAPQQAIKSIPPALEGEVLTAGPPGKSYNNFKWNIVYRNIESLCCTLLY